MSFYTICETEEEIMTLWEKLMEGGKAMMPLETYDWSEKYGWVADRFGVSWQLTLGKIADLGQKITPALMYTGDQFGRAEEAMKWYTSIFDDSAIVFMYRYDAADTLQGGKIAHSPFSLLGQKFIAMDSGLSSDFRFTEGMSLVIDCAGQAEIDHYWNRLTDGGEESQCGWLKDRFGLSWQVVPSILSKLMSDPARAPRVTEAFMKMKKFDIEKLLQA
jgi:predicted 3-demethylubiquinone-9 3-methyltransferase (glyoxalase superfamily)